MQVSQIRAYANICFIATEWAMDQRRRVNRSRNASAADTGESEPGVSFPGTERFRIDAAPHDPRDWLDSSALAGGGGAASDPLDRYQR